MALPRRREFSAKTKLAAWHRAGGPDDPRCECGKGEKPPREGCGLPITKADPAEYHHIGDRDDNSPENCACCRQSCHRRLSDEVTMPTVKRDRLQERMEANVKAPKRPVPGSRAHHLKKKANGDVVDRRTGERVWPR